MRLVRRESRADALVCAAPAELTTEVTSAEPKQSCLPPSRWRRERVLCAPRRRTQPDVTLLRRRDVEAGGRSWRIFNCQIVSFGRTTNDVNSTLAALNHDPALSHSNLLERRAAVCPARTRSGCQAPWR